MRYLLVKKEKNKKTHNLYCPDIYGAETWGSSSSQAGLKKKRKAWYIETWCCGGEVLEYRGIRFPIDDQWGDAWFKKKNGEITHFRLDWDWWYPIDEYLDLYNI